MTQPTQLIADTVISYEIPERAENFRIMKFSKPNTLSYDYSIERGERVTAGLVAMIDLPPGNWQFVCTTKEVTTMHAPELFGHAMISDQCAQDTINSLLTSKGLDVNKNYALIKKLP